MAEASKKRARTKVTLASLEFNKFIASMRFEREGRVLLDTFMGPNAHIATLPQTDDEWAAATLTVTTIPMLLTRPCALADGSVLALASLGQGGRRLVSVDLESSACREAPQPDGLSGELDDLIAFRGSAIAMGAWADRVQCGYDGVVLATGERLAVPRANPQRPPSEVQVYAFADDAKAALVLADGAAYVWKGDAITPVQLPFSLRSFDFGQRDRAITLDDGRLVLCCGDAADTGRSATSYRTFTMRWFDKDGRTGVCDPSIEYAVVGWAGPDGAMIVHKPEQVTEHLFSIVWTRTREVSEVPRAWARYRKFAHDVVYSPTARALVCLQIKKAGARVTAIPWREIEALPRRPLGSP